MVKSPVWWLGGKSKIADKLVELFPPHKVYVEPFGGGAHVLMAKPPSDLEVYNDIDSGLVNFYRVLRDKQKFAHFVEQMKLTPYSKEEYILANKGWRDTGNSVEKARRWFLVARLSFGGVFGGGYGYTAGDGRNVRAYLSAVDGLNEVHERLRMVQVDHDDFRKIFPRYDSPDTLFYCDPPYVAETRRAGEYEHEMTLADHTELVRLLLSAKGKIVLSGYQHDVYAPLQMVGWTVQSVQAVCHAAGKTKASGLKGQGKLLDKQQRVEMIWMSPSCKSRGLF